MPPFAFHEPFAPSAKRLLQARTCVASPVAKVLKRGAQVVSLGGFWMCAFFALLMLLRLAYRAVCA